MPTKRRPLQRIAGAADAGNYCQLGELRRSRLVCALGLNRFGERSPLPSEILARGVSPDFPPSPNSERMMDKSYEKCSRSSVSCWRSQVGPIAVEAYERNLAEADRATITPCLSAIRMPVIKAPEWIRRHYGND